MFFFVLLKAKHIQIFSFCQKNPGNTRHVSNLRKFEIQKKNIFGKFVLVAIGLFRFETDFRVPEKIFGEYFCRERFSILFSASIMVKTFFLTFQAKV